MAKMVKIQHEAIEQELLFKWVNFIALKHPEVALMFHIPNGGYRDSREAANLKKQGVRAGVPDLFLPVPSGKWHGLFIELKYGKNKTTANQDEWLNKLYEQGYACAVCRGWESAAKAICKYLNITYI